MDTVGLLGNTTGLAPSVQYHRPSTISPYLLSVIGSVPVTETGKYRLTESETTHMTQTNVPETEKLVDKKGVDDDNATSCARRGHCLCHPPVTMLPSHHCVTVLSWFPSCHHIISSPFSANCLLFCPYGTFLPSSHNPPVISLCHTPVTSPSCPFPAVFLLSPLCHPPFTLVTYDCSTAAETDMQNQALG